LIQHAADNPSRPDKLRRTLAYLRFSNAAGGAELQLRAGDLIIMDGELIRYFDNLLAGILDS